MAVMRAITGMWRGRKDHTSIVRTHRRGYIYRYKGMYFVFIPAGTKEFKYGTMVSAWPSDDPRPACVVELRTGFEVPLGYKGNPKAIGKCPDDAEVAVRKAYANIKRYLRRFSVHDPINKTGVSKPNHLIKMNIAAYGQQNRVGKHRDFITELE